MKGDTMTPSETAQQINIVMFGAPGAGKGTHAELLAKRFGLFHLSTGDLLRAEVKAGTDLGKRIQDTIIRGELVDDDTVVELVNQKLANEKRGIIFDGFPRTVQQASLLDTILQWTGGELSCVLSIDVPEEELIRRMNERARLLHRSDDTIETFCHRLEEYHAKTEPVVEYYRQYGLFVSVSGMGAISETNERLIESVEKMVFFSSPDDQ
ncbi:MAG: adenylate kinase [Bacteroidales bacterium]|nr:adenylate kinase [Bacteroidales bacterium]